MNDNPPQLVTDHPTFFCYPLRGGEKALIQATDVDGHVYLPRITFSLGDDVDTKNNWEISKVNGKLIKLFL